MEGQIPILGGRIIRQTALIFFLFLATVSAANGQDPIPALVKQIEPAVVTIITYDKNGDSLKLGSGFFISPNHVISNRHVLEDAYRGEIKTADGKVYPIEGVVAEDDADLIQFLVNIPATAVKPLKVSVIPPQKGEKIVVIGSPLALEHNISDGIVSFVQKVPGFGHLIQITAPVFHGHSGSPVVNFKGEVVGVVTQQMVPEQNLNLALSGERVTALKVGKLQTLSVWTSKNRPRDWLPEADSLYWTGLAFLWVEDYRKALLNFEQAAKKNTRYAKAFFQVGYCNGKLERYQEEIEAYKEAIRIQPDYADVHYNLGGAYSNLGRNEEAVLAYKEAIRIKPDYAEAHNNLGTTYNKLGRYGEAVLSYQEVIRIKPDYVNAYYNLGMAYSKLGHYEKEVQAYKQAILIQPNDAEVHRNLGAAYASLGRYQEAIRAYKQAIHVKPDFVDAYCNLGATYGYLDQYQEAVDAFKLAIHLKPEHSEAHYSLGLTYLKFGEKRSALEEYKILQTLDKELADKLYKMLYK